MGNAYLALGALVFGSALLLGCDGSTTTSGGGSCSDVERCGGELAGTWQVTDSCLIGDLVGVLNDQVLAGGTSSECATMFRTASLDVSGTASFENGVETDALSLSMANKIVYTQACESALAGTSVTWTSALCSSIESQLLSTSGGFKTASCALIGQDCTCLVTRDIPVTTTPQAYTVANGVLQYTESGATVDYCVQGESLTVRQVLPDLGGIVMVTRLRPQ